MAPTVVTNSSLAINVVYVPKGSTGDTTASFTTVFTGLIAQGLSQALSPTLGQLFDNLWNQPPSSTTPSLQQTVTAAISAAFPTQAAAMGESVSSVNTVMPSTGTVLAEATNPTPASGSHPAQPGSLQLIYQLPGCTVSFQTEESFIFHFYSDWTITFDAALVFTTPVPPVPCTLTPAVTMNLSNASLHAENVNAAIDEAIDFIVGIFGVSLIPVGQLQQAFNVSQDESTPGSLGALVSALGSIGDEAVPLGFDQLRVSTDGGQLSFDLVHPLDPAPVLSQIERLWSSSLSLSQDEVQAGKVITVYGTEFPADSATQLSVEWNNTSSGTAAGAELQLTDPGNAVVDHPLAAAAGYSYTASALSPGATYEFKARCEDEWTYSQWSKSLKLQTSATDAVLLFLNAASTPTVQGAQVGEGSLAATIANWSGTAAIAADTPPGDYVVVAALGATTLGSAPLTVVGTTSPLEPILDVIDTSVDPPMVIASPAFVTPGVPFTVRGEYFPPGTVLLSVQGGGADVLAQADASGAFQHSLLGPGNSLSHGVFSVTATGADAKSAMTTVEEIEQPK